MLKESGKSVDGVLEKKSNVNKITELNFDSKGLNPKTLRKV